MSGSGIVQLPPRLVVPGVFNVTNPTEAGIRSAIDQAVAAGGGTIYYPDATIALSASLPLIPGLVINHIGVAPGIRHTGQIPDDTFAFTGEGTILTGNGTFPAFRPGQNDSLTYYDDSPVTLASVDTTLDTITFTYDPNWQTGVAFTVQNTVSPLTAGTVYYLRRLSANVYETYDTKPHAITIISQIGLNNLATATASAYGNVTPNQVFTSNGTPSSQTPYSTTTSNATTFTVAGGGAGADFVVNQGVVFNATANGTLTIGKTYYIKTISTNTLSIAATPGGAAITVGTGNPGMTPWLSNEVSDVTIKDIGFGGSAATGFTRAVSAGAKNQMGLAFCTLDNLWIHSCTTAAGLWDPDMWGLYLANFHHTRVLNCRFYNVSNNCWFAGMVHAGTLQTGNSVHSNLVAMNNLMSAADRRKQRGFCYVAMYEAFLNELNCDRFQFTRFNVTQLSETATCSAGTSVTVADSSLYTVGMPVVFSTTRGNITADQVLFVKSIVDATNITVSNARNTAAVTGSAATSVLKTWGQPDLEFYGDRVAGSATTSKVTNVLATNLDLEGNSSAQLLLEVCQSGVFTVSQLGNTEATIHPHVVMRGAQPNYVLSLGSTDVITDIDGTSDKSRVDGARNMTSSLQNTGAGLFYNAKTTCYELALGSSNVATRGGGLQWRAPAGGGFIYPAAAVGLAIKGDYGGGSGGTFALTGADAGFLRPTGTGTFTLNLPTISGDSLTAATSSQIGLQYTILNNRTGVVTVTAQGTQYINGISAHVSVTLAAPSGSAVAWARFTACEDSVGGTGFYWFVELGPAGAAIV